MRIDILTEIDGVGFEEAWQAREHLTFEGVVVPFIGRKHLLRNKRASGRPKDLADVALLLGVPAEENKDGSGDA